MRLVICDGNRILSEALADALKSDHGLNTVAVTTAAECVAAIGSHLPTMCVLEVRLPETADGLRLICEIRDRFPDIAVVIASSVSDPGTVAKAKDLGIAGFLPRAEASARWRTRYGGSQPTGRSSTRCRTQRPIGIPHLCLRPASQRCYAESPLARALNRWHTR